MNLAMMDLGFNMAFDLYFAEMNVSKKKKMQPRVNIRTSNREVKST